MQRYLEIEEQLELEKERDLGIEGTINMES